MAKVRILSIDSISDERNNFSPIKTNSTKRQQIQTISGRKLNKSNKPQRGNKFEIFE